MFFDSLATYRDYHSPELSRPLRFLFAGDIEQKKGLDELQADVLSLPERGFELHWAGAFPEESKARHLNLLAESHVTYHGMLSHKALATFMSKSNVFAFPSRAEGNGNSTVWNQKYYCIFIEQYILLATRTFVQQSCRSSGYAVVAVILKYVDKIPIIARNQNSHLRERTAVQSYLVEGTLLSSDFDTYVNSYLSRN